MRAHFPSLSPDLAYLDNAAGAMLPQSAINAVTRFLTTHGGANVKQSFALSRDVTALKDEARRQSAAFLGCGPDEVVIGPSATALAWQLSRAFSRLWGSGDEVIVSELEHEANHSPWRALERVGVTVRIWRACWPGGELSPADLQELLSPRTKLVALCAAANSVGSLAPVEEAAALARTVGAWTLVDAVHSAPHFLPEAAGWGVDFALVSPYKVFGPHLGLMFVKRDLVSGLPAEKLSFVPGDDITKFEAGTAQHELLAGWLGSLAYLAELGEGELSRATLQAAYRRIEALEAPLVARLVEGLGELPQVTLYGQSGVAGRVGTVCFNVAGVAPRAVAEHLAREGVAVAAGHYYSLLPLGALGLLPLGAVRASVAHYTALEEVERLLEGLRSLKRRE